MPSIKYKKKTYAGATFPVLEMTKAEYDALPEAKKMDGTVYMITDDTGGWEAENASYDNSQSGLTATNVQSALDEVNAKIGYKFNIYSAFPKTGSDVNRLKITVPSEPYLYLSGIILSRYGVYTFNMSENANCTLSCTASKLSGSSAESVTTSVSNFTALFAFTSTWNNFGVIFMTPSSTANIIFDVDKV